MLTMICMPAILLADDSKYLAGAVPEVDGKVVFTKEFDLPGLDRNSVYDHIYNWLDGRMKANNNTSRIVYAEKEKWQIVAAVEEYIVFADKALLRDRALLSYNIVVSCSSGKCEVRIERIRYKYDDKKYTAEEIIADNIALNKKKTSIYVGCKKFRIKTVDYVDDMFENVHAFFNGKDDASKTK